MKIRIVLLFALACSLIFIAQPVFSEEKPIKTAEKLSTIITAEKLTTIITAEKLTTSDVQPFFQRIADEFMATTMKVQGAEFNISPKILGIHQSGNSATVYITTTTTYTTTSGNKSETTQWVVDLIRFNSGQWYVLWDNDFEGCPVMFCGRSAEFLTK